MLGRGVGGVNRAGLAGGAGFADDVPRMPLTLYKYILRDLLKLLTIATLVLVVMLSMGFAIKPISEGLLGPWQLVRVIGYLMPGMLTYALPFAASFAATMVYFRLAADNEITACAASGISYRSVAVPVLMLGVVLMLAMFFLSNWVVPVFWLKVERLIQQDVTRLVIEQIRRRETVEIAPRGSADRLILYADQAEIREMPEEPGGPYQRIILQGAAVGRIDKLSGRLEFDYTGRLAVADFYRYRERLYVTVALTDATVKDPDAGTLVSVARQDIAALEIPSPFQQKPKLMSLPRLREIAAEPDGHSEIREYTQWLAEAYIRQNVARYIESRLAGEGSLQLRGVERQSYQVQAPQVRHDNQAVVLEGSEDQPVRVRVSRGLAFAQQFEAAEVRLTIKVDEAGGEPRIHLTLRDVTVIDPNLPTPTIQTQRPSVYRPGLRLREEFAEPVAEMKALQLLEVAAEDQPGHAVRSAAARLVGGINELRRDITAQLHERAAMAVNCLLVMLLGAMMAMLLRRQAPLAIFFWCFLPTIMAILMMSGAENFVRSNPFGLPAYLAVIVIWVGDVFLFITLAVAYGRLERN